MSVGSVIISPLGVGGVEGRDKKEGRKEGRSKRTGKVERKRLDRSLLCLTFNCPREGCFLNEVFI